MTNDELSIVQKLPEYYQWRSTDTGRYITTSSSPLERWVGFKLLTGFSNHQTHLLMTLSAQLNDMTIENSLITIKGEMCLFVPEQDSDVVLRLLKNMGAGIAS